MQQSNKLLIYYNCLKLSIFILGFYTKLGFGGYKNNRTNGISRKSPFVSYPLFIIHNRKLKGKTSLSQPLSGIRAFNSVPEPGSDFKSKLPCRNFTLSSILIKPRPRRPQVSGSNPTPWSATRS